MVHAAGKQPLLFAADIAGAKVYMYLIFWWSTGELYEDLLSSGSYSAFVYGNLDFPA
jgi:hypothetical protein